MGRRLRSPRLPGVDVPGVDASMSPRPQPRRAMRWADVYVCKLADGVALRNRCPQGQADPGGAGRRPRPVRTPRYDAARAALAEAYAELCAESLRPPSSTRPGVSSTRR